MGFVLKLFLLFFGVLGMAIVGLSLALWGTHEARYNLTRTDLAHRSYESYLSLSNHTYQLFKQFGDAMTIGDRDQGTLETQLLALIREDIARIRQTIAAEIQLVGDEEIQELARLADIERQIDNLLEEYQTVLDANYAIPFSDEWGRLSKVLDEKVDLDFNQLIHEALDEELAELAEQQERTRSRLALNQELALIAAGLGVVAAVAGFWWLVRDLKVPIARLISGAQALAQGERGYRLEVVGDTELDRLAHAFNQMAAEIVARESVLEASNQRLEQAVAERTAELERLLDALKTAEADRRRLLADVSHELRTPLTIIRGEADIALRGGDKTPAEYRLALEKAREAAAHTARLVDDLLFIARREAGEARLTLREVNLSTFVPLVIDDCRSLALSRGGIVRYQQGPPSAIVPADPDRLRQVLLILLDNALRYGGTRIDVCLAQAAGGYRIQVCDDGPGLDAEDLARVFQRFYRGANASRHSDQGAGLGLPVAKAIVEAHNGEIDIASEPGQGVCVSLRLSVRPRLEAVS